MQNELALLGQITNELRRLSDSLVARCKTEQQAFRMCIRESRVPYTSEQIAEHLGMTRASLNTILNSDSPNSKRFRSMSRVRQVKLQQLCGNTVIDQWADLYARGMLDSQRQPLDELAELEARAKALREQLAAQPSVRSVG